MARVHLGDVWLNDARTVADRVDLVADRRTTEQLVMIDTATRDLLGKPLAECTDADLDRAIEWLEHMRSTPTPGGGTPWAPAAPFPA